ncbi:hypothetical protein CHLNCDRAFT_133543 [Chlorella variabilis]|uniref:MYND-type domain-containing protein n=1 Tax=Chlorella variabilis TaxID=554065 RepID=E1Z3B1_CHLVA|nr:hypothetical protein CHLNCDRAFT_133543 [Chlorella variabilis]EFN59810.1 hypothetical protein CHLNCDRAFT_133543 [Chlorella variabilis]|eukprot:XP_005851912.1 hypothetical protein CHLNCDRAFT_133543 [Chlorella variabilis]
MEEAVRGMEEADPGSSDAASATHEFNRQLACVRWLKDCMLHPSLEAGLSGALHAESSGHLVEPAVRLAAALPLRASHGIMGDALVYGHVAAGQVLWKLVLAMRLTLAEMRAAEQLRSDARAAQKDGGRSQGVSGGEQSPADIDDGVQGGSGCSDEGGSGAASSTSRKRSSQHFEERRAAAWQVVQLLLPRMEAVLCLAQAQAEPRCSLDVACICQNFAVALSLFVRDGNTFDLGPITSEEQVSALAEAACAALRLLPRLAQIHDSWQQQTPAAASWIADQQGAPALLAFLLFNNMFCMASVRSAAVAKQICGTGLSAAAAASLAGGLLRLHNLSCCMVHWLATAGRRSTLLPEMFGEKEEAPIDWHRVIAVVGSLRSVICLLLKAAGMGGTSASPSSSWRHMEVLHQAHQEAVQVAIAAEISLQPSSADATSLLTRCSAIALFSTAKYCPQLLAVDSGFASLLVQSILAQAGSSSAPLLEAAYEARDSAQLAALLAATGLLGGLLEETRALGGDGGSTVEKKGMDRLLLFAGVMLQLEQAGLDVAAALDGSPAGGRSDADQQQQQQQQRDALQKELQAALTRMQAAWAEAQRGGQPLPLAGRAELYQREAMPAAIELGALLQQYWSLPEQVAAAELKLAEIAACRPCAHLRCPRLDTTSGDSRNKLCAGCRAVRFCSPACSKAAWKAGHKRVCGALAAKQQLR